MIFKGDSDSSDGEDSYEIRESIQDNPQQVTYVSSWFRKMKLCFCYLFVKNRKYEQQAPRGAFFGFITPNFINCLGALYYLRLGYVIGQSGFVYALVSLFATMAVIVFMQINAFLLFHHRPYYERKDLTLFLILKKTFGIELTTLLSFQQFVHHSLNCINNLIGLTILFSHFYLQPFFEETSSMSRSVLAVTIASFIFLVIGVGCSLLFFNIRSIFSFFSFLLFFVSIAMCIFFFVSLVFQEADVCDGFCGWSRPSNFGDNLFPNYNYRYALKLEVPGNMIAIMSPIVLDISFCRSFKSIKKDHVRSALFMDITLFIFTFLVIVLVTFEFLVESLLYDITVFLEVCFLPFIFSLLLTASICYTISSYLQSMTNLVDTFIHYGEWKFFRKFFGFRKAVICFLIHIFLFLVFILIEYIGVSLYVTSKFTALVTLMFILTMNLSMFFMLVIGRLPPKNQHIPLFRKFILGTFYVIVFGVCFVMMLMLSIELCGIACTAMLTLFLVITLFTSPYTGVLPQWFLLNQMKKVLRMSRFESRDRLKSLNIIHFVPTPKNSYPSIALFTLFNNYEGIYTIANIQHPRFYNEGEHLHRIRREREFWLAFLDQLQLNRNYNHLKFVVSHSVRRGVQSMCLTNEWKRNVACLGFPTVKKRDLKIGKYTGIDIFSSESFLTECLRKFTTDQWHTKLRNQQEYIGILKDLLYIFQLNVIVYHRLDKLDKHVFRGDDISKKDDHQFMGGPDDPMRHPMKKKKKRKKRRKLRKRRSLSEEDTLYDDSIVPRDEKFLMTSESDEELINNNNKNKKMEEILIDDEDDDGRMESPTSPTSPKRTSQGFEFIPQEEDEDYLAYRLSRRKFLKKKQYFDIWLIQQDLEANSSSIFCLKMLSYINEKWFLHSDSEAESITFRLFYIVKKPSLIPVYEKKFEEMLRDCRVRKKVEMCIQCYSNLSHQYYYDSIPELEKVMLFGEMLKKFSDRETVMIFCVFDPPKANELGGEYWKKLKALVKSVETPILLFFAPDFEEDDDSNVSDVTINLH